MKNVDKKSITVWSLESLSTTLIYAFIGSVIFYFLRDYNVVKKLYIIGMALLLTNFLLDICLNTFTYRKRFYQLTDETLYIQKAGLTARETTYPTNRFYKNGLTIRNVTVPLRRIQHVDMEQSLISRLFNLYQVNIYTAGNFQRVAYLSKEDAINLKDSLISFAVSTGEKIDE